MRKLSILLLSLFLLVPIASAQEIMTNTPVAPVTETVAAPVVDATPAPVVTPAPAPVDNGLTARDIQVIILEVGVLALLVIVLPMALYFLANAVPPSVLKTVYQMLENAAEPLLDDAQSYVESTTTMLDDAVLDAIRQEMAALHRRVDNIVTPATTTTTTSTTTNEPGLVG